MIFQLKKGKKKKTKVYGETTIDAKTFGDEFFRRIR